MSGAQDLLTIPSGAAESAPGRAPAHVLVLDDHSSIRLLLGDVLSANQYQVSLSRNIEEASQLLATESFDAIIVDIFLEDKECGLSLLPRIRELQPHTPTIVVSGMASMDNVIEALKAGAYDLLCKPFNIIDVLHVVARAVDKKRLAEENERLVQALREERDRLEERVEAATADLTEKVETLRLLNDQVAGIFELSQVPAGEGSSQGTIARIFELLRRMIDFEGAFCVVYDLTAKGINLVHSEGESVREFCETMTQLFRERGATLAEMAEAQGSLPVSQLQDAIRWLYPGPWPAGDVMLMPLYVHQTLLGAVGLIRTSTPAHLSSAEERLLAIAISHFLSAIEQRNFIARTGQLAGLGELISEIAHDLRHPMTALRGASRILVDGWREEGRRNRCLDEIQGNLGRMESLVSELVNFYNPKEMNMVPVDIHTLLDKAVEVSGFLLEQKRIVIERRFEPEPLVVLGLTRNLIEALINLISNACQAMSEEGQLRLATHGRLDEEHRARLQSAGYVPSRYLMLTVEDTGCGIPEENRDRIFRRFFTTRPEGHGLGLSAVQRIIKKNLGHIHWKSQVGQGTTFYLYLPKA